MFLFDKIDPESLDRRQLQLTILACSAMLILGAGDKRAAESKIEASAELLSAIPNLSSFKDRLAMEYGRAVADD